MSAPTLSESAPGMLREMSVVDDARIADLCLGVAKGWTSLFALPIEVIGLRPLFCTRYFHPVTAIFSTMLLSLLAVAGLATESPMASFQEGQAAPIGGFMFMVFFYVALMVHSPRLWRRIQHMELEVESHEEGPPLPIFRALPYADSWVVVRIAYEPALVFLLAIVLFYAGIITPLLAIYLMLAAAALCLKNAIRFYDVWSMLRDALDGQARSKTVGAFVSGRMSPAGATRTILESLSQKVPQETRQQAAVRMAGHPSSPETEALLSSLTGPSADRT